MPRVGTKSEVWAGTAHHTSGGLTKGDLMRSNTGKIVSKKQHAAGVRLMKALRASGKAAAPFKKGHRR
jgi:hypothetical protein